MLVGEMIVILEVIKILCFCVIFFPSSSEDHISTTLNNVTNSVPTNNRNGRIYFNQIFSIAGFFTGDNTSSESQSEHNDEEEEARNCTCECGHPNQEHRIVGGRPTSKNRYPWIARIVYDGHFHCGGSVIAEDYILTAAHCVRRLKRSKIRVILGDHDQSTTEDAPAKMRAVSAVLRHRNFDSETYNHDIALLKLRKSIEFSKNIRPVCLPSAKDPSGKTGTVIGWGRTMEGGMLPSIVQEVEVPILSLSQCRAMKYRSSRITSYMLCAGRGAMDSCQGDSGGPLVLSAEGKYQVVGIVSWGVGCGRPGYPGVYTRVSKYLKWIKLNIDNACLCG